MTKQKKLFAILIIGLLLVGAFGCSKAQKKETKEQAEEKQPEKQAVQIQEKPAEEKLIDYKIARQWAVGMEVSIPHPSTEKQIKQLNDMLLRVHFPSRGPASIQYHCLDHPELKPYIKKAATTTKYFMNKEMIATYDNGGLDIWAPTPEERYPNIITMDEIKKLDAESADR